MVVLHHIPPNIYQRRQALESSRVERTGTHDSFMCSSNFARVNLHVDKVWVPFFVLCSYEAWFGLTLGNVDARFGFFLFSKSTVNSERVHGPAALKPASFQSK